MYAAELKRFGIDVREDVELCHRHTFGLPARAAWHVTVRSLTDLVRLRQSALWAAVPQRMVLGGGSNVLFLGYFDGLVVSPRLSGRDCIGEFDDHWLVAVNAGENWDAFVRWTIGQGWGGLENLAAIPGTAGASPVQNIGAYGIELDERVAWIEAIDLTSGEPVTLRTEQCGFAYRNSIFRRHPGRWLIHRVVLRLPKQWVPRIDYGALSDELSNVRLAELTPQRVADTVTTIRGRKLPDPARLGNAGSFFKNPVLDAARFDALRQRWPQVPSYPQPDGSVKVPAAWFIEQCGWRGMSLGRVGCHIAQALVLVNQGGAQADDLVRVVTAIRHDVFARFSIAFEIEPVVLGTPELCDRLCHPNVDVADTPRGHRTSH